MNEILPVKRSKSQARRNYDRLSKVYDLLTVSEKPLIKQGIDLLAIRSGEHVLEIGCGPVTGLKFVTKALGHQGKAIGLDLSHQMLKKSQGKGITPAPQLIQADGARLPLRSAEFDAVFSAFTVELFTEDDIRNVLGECRRVLKPLGRLGIVSLANSPHTLALQLYEQAHRLFPVAVDCRPIPLAALLKDRGFQLIRSEKTHNWGLPIGFTLSTKRQA